MREIRLSLFATSTPAGRELATLLDNAFASEFPGGLKVNMEIIMDGDDGDMLVAGARDDIVVFDASIEDEIGSNYKAVRMWPLCMDHFLVVSRTRLPINFQPFHEGGSPDTWENVLDRPFSLNNQELVRWIKKLLKVLAPQLPRPCDEYLEITKDQFGTNAQAFENLTRKLIINSLKRREIYRKDTGRTFVSYISRYSKYHRQSTKFNGSYVEDLVNHIKRQHGSASYPVLYYPPGSLSSEFMVEYRRWQIVRMIEARIRASDEFWIFETDDYYNSWWTQAELAVLSYIQHSGEHPIFGKLPAPKVFLCKPSMRGLQVRKADSEFIRKLDRKTERELGRCLANTNYYEQVRSLQAIRNLPEPLQWLTFQSGKLFKSLGEAVLGVSSVSKEEWRELKKQGLKADFGTFKDLLKSHAFSVSFWNDRIVTCPNCVARNRAQNNLFNFQDFLLHSAYGQFRVSPEELDTFLMTNTWSCGACGFQFRVVQEPYPQFKWWSIRWGRPTGPNDVFIERIPLYSLQRIS